MAVHPVITCTTCGLLHVRFRQSPAPSHLGLVLPSFGPARPMPARPFHRPAHRCKVGGVSKPRGEHARTEHDACTRFTNGSVPRKASKVKRNFWASPARQTPTPTRLRTTSITGCTHWMACLPRPCCVFSGQSQRFPTKQSARMHYTVCVFCQLRAPTL